MSRLKASILLLLTSPAFALEGFVVGAGVEVDSAEGQSATIIGNLGLTEVTWLSGGFAKNSADIRPDLTLETIYADIGIDHWFKPIGFRAGVSYWGDDSILDSFDLNGAVYWRGGKASIAGEFEYRDFEFDIFRNDLLPGQAFEFHAVGAGLTARFDVGKSASISFSTMDYNYNVNLKLDANSRIADLLSVSRLSLINSLIDYRAGISLGVDAGQHRLNLDFSTWEGEVDSSRTNSTTLRWIAPLGNKNDLELGIGFDDSDIYGSVTFMSIFFYFYGG